MADVVLEKLKKSFGSVDVIHGVDLGIKSGEFVVFVGPSGCGKSTLLRLIAGLEDATSGELFIGDENVTDVEPAERGVAMVFQSYALYPHMNVADNMGFGLKMTGHTKADVEARVKRASEILHLENLLTRKPKQLSGGQRQRVAIGRAIVREPKVFLFDEPLSNLDAELRVQMRLEIANLHQELGATMVYVTHDQVEAMTLADKIVVLRAGVVEQTGSPIELYENPDNAFVAGFIGSPRMNFLKATAGGTTKAGVEISLDDYSGVKFRKKLQNTVAQGTQLLLGIRPEHFSDGGKVKLKPHIDVIENLGGVAFAYSRSSEDQPLTIQLSEGHKCKERAEFKTSFDAEQSFAFDRASEQRMR